MPLYHSLRSATVAAAGTKSQTRPTSQLRETEKVIRCACVWWAEHSLPASSRGTTATGGAEQCDICAFIVQAGETEETNRQELAGQDFLIPAVHCHEFGPEGVHDVRNGSWHREL